MLKSAVARSLRLLGTPGAGVAALCFAAGANAQSTAPTRETLDEIVVTAQKRSESLQDVPLAVSAVKGDELEFLGSQGFSTYAERVPSVQMAQLSPINTQIAMRGVATALVTIDQVSNKSTVGVYLDDVPIDLVQANPNFQLTDLERVEVLRGPQGTLYGAGSMGGAIRMVTRKPDLSTFGAGGGLSLSQTEQGSLNTQIDGVLNVPLVDDRLAARVVGYYSQYGGWIDNIAVGKNGSNDWTTSGGRVALRARPTDAFTVDLQGIYQKTKLDDGSGSIDSLGWNKRSTSILEATDQESRLVTLNAEYDFGPATLASVSSWQLKNEFFTRDIQNLLPLFGLPNTILKFDFPNYNETRAISQELRLQSNGKGPLRWLVGAFFNRRTLSFEQSIDAPGLEALGFPPGSLFGVGKDRVLYALAESKTRQYAAFAEVTYAFTPKLEATLGARWFKGRDVAHFDLRGLLEGGIDVTDPKVEGTGTNPKLNVSYAVTPQNLVYAQVAKGFRLGGTNTPIPVSFCGADLAALGLREGPAGFAPDTLRNYEVGSKNSLGGGRVVLNASAYLIDWKEIQTQTSLPCGFAVIQNTGRVRSRGLEFEANALVAEGLRLSTALTYTNSEIRKDLPPLGARAGDAVPFVPKFQGLVEADYQWPIGTWRGFVTATARHTGERKTSLARAINRDLDAYTVGDLKVGARRDGWEALLFVDNVSDERVELYGGVARYTIVEGPSTLYQRPRTYGLRVRKSF